MSSIERAIAMTHLLTTPQPLHSIKKIGMQSWPPRTFQQFLDSAGSPGNPCHRQDCTIASCWHTVDAHSQTATVGTRMAPWLARTRLLSQVERDQTHTAPIRGLAA